MKYLKLKLILLVIFILASFMVIGDFRLDTITYPVIIIYIPFLMYKPLKNYGLLSIFYPIILLGCIVCFLFNGCGFFLCAYRDNGYEYVNKKNKNIKIVGRDYSCFMTTGDLVLYKRYSLTDNIGFEIYYKTFPDYKNITIDNAVWKRIDK
jgi:hypothetical protein